MLFEAFKAKVVEFWNAHLTAVEYNLAARRLRIRGDRVILYPTTLIFVKCPKFFAVELLGARRDRLPLSVKEHETDSIYLYLNSLGDVSPTDGENCISVGEMLSRHAYLWLSNEPDMNRILARFPHAKRYGTRLLWPPAMTSPYKFNEEFRDLTLTNVFLAFSDSQTIRARDVLHLGIYRNNISQADLSAILANETADQKITGIHLTSPGTSVRLLIASQLQNIFLTAGIRETTIGDLFNRHPEILYYSFQTPRFLYEPSLKWVQHDGNVKEATINPDLLVQRENGSYDIVDFKTALLDQKSLTVGMRSRRKFASVIEDGIAQLANYREYFRFPKNPQWALENLKVSINDPKLILIVGTRDNFKPVEVREARLRYPNVEIIDFDTLIQGYLNNAPN